MKKAFTMIELVFAIVVIGILAATIMPSTSTRITIGGSGSGSGSGLARTVSSSLMDATMQLVSHIRYTQHLALIDDTYDSNRIDSVLNVIWYKDRWQLVFSSSEYSDGKPAYTIFSDNQGTAVSRGDANEDEVARNPENSNQIMTGGYSATQALNYGHSKFKGMKKLNLGNSYGVTSIVLSGGCEDGRISFDHLGRPMQGDHNTVTSPYNAATPYDSNKQRLITSNCIVEVRDGDDYINIIIRPETGYTTIEY